jgi:hypothetical protein
MPRLRLWRFALCFVAFYGLLILPWPGLHHAVGAYVQAFGNGLFGRTGRHVVQFRARGPADKSYAETTDTMMLLYNNDIVDRSKRAGWLMGFDTKQLFWLQFSFYLALVGATPVPWRRRVWALFWGILAANVLLALTLAAVITDHASDISMVALSPFWKTAVTGLAKLLIVVSGPSTLAYFVIWPFACFRRENLARLAPGWRDRMEKPAAAHGPDRPTWRAQLKAARKSRS